MKAMIASDLITARKALLQMFGICVFVSIFMVWGTDSMAAGIAATVAMMIMLGMLNLAGYDEMNGWQAFRLTLPISRSQVVWGRYASIALVGVVSAIAAVVLGFAILLVAAALPVDTVPQGFAWSTENAESIPAAALLALFALLAAAALSLPLIMRFGVTKGTRWLPMVIVMVMAVGIVLSSYLGLDIEEVLGGPLAALGPWGVGALGALLAIALYAASGALSVRLYRKREL